MKSDFSTVNDTTTLSDSMLLFNTVTNSVDGLAI